jgi:hypothetical protein
MKKRRRRVKTFEHSRIAKDELVKACQRFLELASQYKPGEHHREMGYDGLLFGYLDARFGGLQRQYKIRMGSSNWPKRIDFRQGGTGPVLIEFVVRTPGRNEIYGSQNSDELRKLSRQRKASARYLLLLDLSKKPPLDLDDLWGTYKEINSGPGKFKRKSVRVVYVHPDVHGSFLGGRKHLSDCLFRCGYFLFPKPLRAPRLVT